MPKLTSFSVLLLGAILGGSESPKGAFAPREELRAPPPIGIRAAAAPAVQLAVAAKDKDKKTDKPKEAKHPPAGWYADYNQALAKAKSTGQPLLVLFH